LHSNPISRATPLFSSSNCLPVHVFVVLVVYSIIMTLRNTFAFIGRLLIAGYFINSVVVHVQRPETMAPLVKQIVSTFAVPAAYKQFVQYGLLGFEMFGALAILFRGTKHIGSLFLSTWLIMTNVLVYNFWTQTGSAQQTSLVSFVKNLAIVGGLIHVACDCSSDSDGRKHKHE